MHSSKTNAVLFASLILLPLGLALAWSMRQHSLFPTSLGDATNPERILLFEEGDAVTGWISGTTDHEGATVRVVQGDRATDVKIGAGNLFRAPVANRDVPLRVRFGDHEASLRPALRADARNCVYFIVDRGVYRPKQEMRFAGYVRRLGPDRRFTPITNHAIKVVLRNASRGTVARAFELTTDEHGRIVGSYTFSEGDAVDDYTLQAPNHHGSVTLKLAEFRKSKVRLKLDHEVVGGKLAYTFRALDFLDNAVPGTRVDYDLQVVSSPPAPPAEELNPRFFVVDSGPGLLAGLSEENRLLVEAGLPIRPDRSSWPQVVHHEKRTLSMKESGEASGELTLRPEWVSAGYKVVVNGVMIDHNGREQRSSCEVSLARDAAEAAAKAEPAETKPSLLQTFHGQRRFQVGDTVRLRGGDPEDRGVLLVHRTGQSAPAIHRGGRRHSRYSPWRMNGVLEEDLYTAVPLDDGAASLTLEDPGVYRLETIVQTPQGEVRDEVTILVSETRNPLAFRLEAATVSDQGQIRGTLHTAFEGAQVLLTLADGRGVQVTRPLWVREGVADFAIPVPAGTGFGATLTAWYPVSNTVHQTSEPIRVLPDSRSIEITADVPETVKPGEEVEIALAVDREEEVDLVVSVYDHSLLGIAPDRSVDIRSFFLADEHARDQDALESVAHLLGDLSRAEAFDLLKETMETTTDPAFKQLLGQWVPSYVDNSHFYAVHVALLLKALGHQVHLSTAMQNQWSIHPNHKGETIAQALRRHARGNRVYLRRVGDCFVFSRHLGQYNPYGYGYYGWGGGGMFLNSHLDSRLSFAHYGGIQARGDAWHSFAPSANGFISGNAVISGQALMSLPAGLPAPAPIQAAPGSDGQMVRRNFSDTAFFDAAVRTDKRGKATVRFTLPDSLTNWRVVVHAVGRDMSVGQVEARFRSYKPIMIWPMPARSFTVGDKVDLYAMVHNRGDKPQEMRVWLEADNGEIHGPAEQVVTVPAGRHTNVHWTYEPAEAGQTALLMATKCAAGDDASLKRLPVRPCEAVSAVTASGLTRGQHSFEIPAEADLDLADLSLTLSPSLPADLSDTLDFLVQYPHGCVEQTMSRFLPLVKVGQILQGFDIDRPALTAKIPGFAEAGVKRLMALQQGDGGWGWIGSSQTHEMMTPYALYGLIEAKKAGFDFDQRRAVENGLNRLHHYIRNPSGQHPADTVYCAYVYSQERDLEANTWQWLEQQARAEDTLSDYALALVLEMCHQKPHTALDRAGRSDDTTAARIRAAHRDRSELAALIARRLGQRAVRQHQEARWTTARFSRWGNDPHEITAAVMKALVAHDPDHPLIPEVLNYFHRTKRGNRWNSTKDTAMVVFAMCDYLNRSGGGARAKQVVFRLNDGPEQAVDFEQDRAVTLALPLDGLKPGVNHIRFVGGDRDAMCRLVFHHRQVGEDIQASDSGLAVTRRFVEVDPDGQVVGEVKPGGEVRRGNYLQVEVIVKQPKGNDYRFVLVNCPKPAGCEIVPVADKRFPVTAAAHALREDRTSNIFWHHEQVRGDNIHNQVMLHTELAGSYLVPPGRSRNDVPDRHPRPQRGLPVQCGGLKAVTAVPER